MRGGQPLKPWRTSEQARARLREVAEERGEPLARLSRLIRRPDGYLSRWVRLGTPEWLQAREAQVIATYLGIDVSEIGRPDAE